MLQFPRGLLMPLCVGPSSERWLTIASSLILACVSTRFPHPERDFTGSVGKALPNIDLKIVDDDGSDISGYDVRGELCVRGPTVVRGYFENLVANQRDWDEDGYFRKPDRYTLYVRLAMANFRRFGRYGR